MMEKQLQNKKMKLAKQVMIERVNKKTKWRKPLKTQVGFSMRCVIPHWNWAYEKLRLRIGFQFGFKETVSNASQFSRYPLCYWWMSPLQRKLQGLFTGKLNLKKAKPCFQSASFKQEGLSVFKSKTEANRLWKHAVGMLKFSKQLRRKRFMVNKSLTSCQR